MTPMTYDAWSSHLLKATKMKSKTFWSRIEINFYNNETINTQNMTNPTIVSLVKMEYGWNFSISGLKMMVKSGLEKIFLKFLHALTIF